MLKILALFLCKLAHLVLKYGGRGSSFPGRLALKICPNILSEVKYPSIVIAVTGSNGKSSTVEMIAHVLKENNKSVAYNYEGSNQLDGVTTLILNNCDYHFNFKKDVLLIETDERSCQYIYKYFIPTYFVITNLYRDQLTRNGNPSFVLKEIKKGIRKESILCINGDDPLLTYFASTLENKIIYYGLEKHDRVSETNDDIYNDAYYCPKCHSKLSYEYYHYSLMGNYYCESCDFKRPSIDYVGNSLDFNKKLLLINNKYYISLADCSLHYVYNCLLSFLICDLVGISTKEIQNSLDDYFILNGRIKNFKTGTKEGTLLISKHENSVSYNQNIKSIVESKKEATLVIMVDSISRKYFTSDTSWLWDINFELLKANNIKEVIVTGAYYNDLAIRMEYAGLSDKLIVRSNIRTASLYARFKGVGHIYLLTCFSDEGKFLKEVDIA